MRPDFDQDAYNTLVGLLAANMQAEAEKIVSAHPEFLGPGRGIPEPAKPLVRTLVENQLMAPLRWVIARGAQIASNATEAQEGHDSFGAELKEAAKAGGDYFQALIDGYGPSVLARMPLGPGATFETQVGLAITWGDEAVLGAVLAAFPEQAGQVSWDGKTPLDQISDLLSRNAQSAARLEAKAHLIRVHLSRQAALDVLTEVHAPQATRLRR